MKLKNAHLGLQYPAVPFPLRMHLIKSSNTDYPKHSYDDELWDEEDHPYNSPDPERQIEQIIREGREAQKQLERLAGHRSYSRVFGLGGPNRQRIAQEMPRVTRDQELLWRKQYARWAQIVQRGLAENPERFSRSEDRPIHLQSPDREDNYAEWEDEDLPEHDWSKNLHRIGRQARLALESMQSDEENGDDGVTEEEELAMQRMLANPEREWGEIRSRGNQEARERYESIPADQRSQPISADTEITPWDEYQKTKQDFYDTNLARKARILDSAGHEDGIYHGVSHTGAPSSAVTTYTGKFGPFALEMSKLIDHDYQQKEEDARNGIIWEDTGDRLLHPNTRPGRPGMWESASGSTELRPYTRLGHPAPNWTLGLIHSLIQYRDKTSEESNKSLKDYAEDIAKHLQLHGFHTVSYNPAASSTTVRGRSLGGSSRQRLFDSIIKHATQKLEQSGTYIKPFTITETASDGTITRRPSIQGRQEGVNFEPITRSMNTNFFFLSELKK